jgi:hypothetical protein
MSSDSNVWTLEGKPRDFHQRSRGELDSAGRQISGSWEASGDGRTWAHDFALTYTKVS